MSDVIAFIAKITINMKERERIIINNCAGCPDNIIPLPTEVREGMIDKIVKARDKMNKVIEKINNKFEGNTGLPLELWDDYVPPEVNP